MKINGRELGPTHPTYIIAEIGMNHNGDVDLGIKHIIEAAKAGVNAVKFQTFHSEAFLSSKYFKIEERKQYEISQVNHEILKKCAVDNDVDFISTPFDKKSVDLLDDLGVPCFKVASGDLTNYPLIRYIASKGKPILFSTGYATLSEIFATYELIRSCSSISVGIFHCVASYPTDIGDMNLNNITCLQESFPCVVGLSDHSLDYKLLPPVAVALGARIIEKHFTIDRSLPGYDHHFSLNSGMMADLVVNIRKVEKALGSPRSETGVIFSEKDRKKSARRGLFWTTNLAEGEVITEDHISLKRPGGGLPALFIDHIVGRKVAVDVVFDDMVELFQVR